MPCQTKLVPCQTKLVPCQTKLVPYQAKLVPCQTKLGPCQTKLVPSSICLSFFDGRGSIATQRGWSGFMSPSSLRFRSLRVEDGMAQRYG